MSQMHSIVVSTPDGMRFYHSLEQKEYDLYQRLTQKGYAPFIAIRNLKVPEAFLPMSQEDQDWMLNNVDSLHWSWVSNNLRKQVSKDEILWKIEELEMTL